MEAFIGLIQQAERIGIIKGVQIAHQAPTITSLCFPDDTLLFYRASDVEALALKEVMDKYIGVFDQVINYDKSSMIFSRHMEVNKRHQI